MRAKTFVTGLLASLAFWAFPTIAGAQSDSDVFAIIDALRPVAASIVVDGDDADWGAIPRYVDPSADVPASPSLEIVASAIAPLEQEMLVWIETAVAPATGMTLGVLVDLVTNPNLDIRIDLDTVGSDHCLTVAEKYG